MWPRRGSALLPPAGDPDLRGNRQAWLLEAFHRRMTFMCRKGQYTIDLVIPIAKSRKGSDSVKDLSARDVTATLMQVRNRSRTSVGHSVTISGLWKSKDYAGDLFSGEMNYLYPFVSVGEESIGDRGNNRLFLEDERARIILSGIEDVLIESPEAAQEFRASASSLLSQVAFSVKRRRPRPWQGKVIVVTLGEQCGYTRIRSLAHAAPARSLATSSTAAKTVPSAIHPPPPLEIGPL